MWTDTRADTEKQTRYNEGLYREARSLLQEIEADLKGHHMLREERIYVKSDSPYERCMTLLFADSLRLYDAVLPLFRIGHLAAAIILVRSLFERLVDALYISKAPRVRVRRYVMFWMIHRADLFLAIKKHSDFPRDADSARMKKYHEVVQEGGSLRRRYKQGGTQHWSGLSLRRRCEVVGLLSHYEILVHEYSSFTHSDPVSSQTTLSGFSRFGGFACSYKDEGKKGSKEYEWALRNALKFQLMLWLVFSRVLRIGLQKNVIKAMGHLKKAKEWSQCFEKNRILWRVAG